LANIESSGGKEEFKMKQRVVLYYSAVLDFFEKMTAFKRYLKPCYFMHSGWGIDMLV
jgi:hypothetical protein